MRRVANALLLLAAAAAGAQPASEPEPAGERRATSRRVVALGPTKAQAASSAPALEFPFVARADEELTGVTVRLAFAPPEPESGRDRAGAVPGLEVLVNEERVALLSPDEVARAPARLELPVERELLGARNSLAVRQVAAGSGACVAIPGAWRRLREIALVLEASPVALPNELALLPLPFLDRGYDDSATIPVVLASPPGPAELRLAGLVAGWFAVDAPIPLAFTAEEGRLPDRSAVVLVAGADAAARLGLEAPRGGGVRMIDHPRHPGSNVKLLVVEGRDGRELAAAVEGLVARSARLAGESMALAAPPSAAAAVPGSAPRWVPSDRAVPFSAYPERTVLAHDGSTPATLAVRFRTAPDLFIWPSEFVVLDLGWSERVPPGATPPRLDVELNGYFLATLPAPRGAGESTARVRLRIPREHMRGFNELLVHVSYPQGDPCAAAAADAPREGGPRVAIAGDSRFHLEGLSHFASLPDVSLFAFDGFPFSRVPDLGETAFVLPDAPTASEVGVALSIVGQLAQVTGSVGTRAAFLAAGRAGEAELRDRDLVLVGARQDHPLLAQWEPQLPLVLAGGRVRPKFPAGQARLLALLGGVGPLLDLHRAQQVLAAAGEVAAIAAIESPVTRGRSAVVVTGGAPERLPAFRAFLGYAEGRSRSADLLVLSGDRRWQFHLGDTFGRGWLDPWTRVRWFLATHWLALVPLVVAGSVVLAVQLRRALAAQMSRRLALEGGP